MLEVIASLSGAAVFVVSLLIRAVSAQPRMLGHIRNEAETLQALPEGHPGREALARELNDSVERYTAYRARSRERYRLGVGLTLLAAGAIFSLMEMAFETLNEKNPLESISDVVVPIGIMLSTLLGVGFIFSWGVPVLLRVEEVLDPQAADERKRRRAKRLIRKERGTVPE